MTKEIILQNEMVWCPSETPFRFTESVDPKTGHKKFIITGLMLPFDKISRNSVLYNKNSVIDKHKALIGRPLMYNHKVDTDMLPKGHFIDSWIESDGWHYKADLDPSEQDIIRKLSRGDLRHISIQLIGGRIVERLNDQNQKFTEAWVDDIIEGSIVPAPGFLDTTAKFSEAFNNKKSEFAIGDKILVKDTGEEGEIVDIVEGEDAFLVQLAEGMRKKLKKEEITTVTARGAMAPAIIVKKPEDEEKEQAHPTEIPDMSPVINDIRKIPTDEELAESLSSNVEVVNVLKEFRLHVGDIVRIPFGVRDIDKIYLGEFGWIRKADDDEYTIEMRDGKKLKIDREVFDISVLTD